VPITIEVSRASQKAIEAIEKAGGKIVTRYYNELGLRSVVHPEKFAQTPKLAAPLRKEDISKCFFLSSRFLVTDCDFVFI
jgi:large subunit ribosomal protein L15